MVAGDAKDVAIVRQGSRLGAAGALVERIDLDQVVLKIPVGEASEKQFRSLELVLGASLTPEADSAKPAPR